MATVVQSLEAIVLAGGAGARFGGGKLTAPWRGGALIDGALAASFASQARSVTVVTGADAMVDAAARAFAGRIGQAERLRVIHCPNHAEGMGATLRTGLASLDEGVAGVFVFLGDMPLIPVDVLSPLANAVAAGALAAAPSFEGKRGHPVLFAATLLPRLAALTGDEGARRVLQGLGEALVLVPTDDPGVLADIDRPADLDQLR